MKKEMPPQNLLDRIDFKAPAKLLSHDFGLPSVRATAEGAAEIAESEAVDIIWLIPDEEAQRLFFKLSKTKESRKVARGGVPLRKPEDLKAIYKSSRCGNFPLLGCSLGRRDLVQWSEMLHVTINLAWGTVPFFWSNTRRGLLAQPLVKVIAKNQEAMRWYACQDNCLEVSEAHHWSSKGAPDTVAVAAAFLAAYNAKNMGIRNYVVRYVLQASPQVSRLMDFARLEAMKELIETLHDNRFTSIALTMISPAALPSDPSKAKGHLAASGIIQYSLNPKIIHLTGPSDSDSRLTASGVVENAKIVSAAIETFIKGLPIQVNVESSLERKEGLLEDVRVLLEGIKKIASRRVKDPWTDASTLALAVKKGLLDAPGLRGIPEAAGKVHTEMRFGACVAVDPKTGDLIPEKERISRLLK